MPRAFSDDLRERILQTYEREKVSLAALAKRYAVSFEYVRKIRKQQLRTGQRKRVPQSRYGSVSRVTEAVQATLRAQVRAQPDLTLAELQERVQQATGVKLSGSLVWLWLQRLGLGRKKNPSTRRNGTRKPISSGANSSGKRWARLPRKN